MTDEVARVPDASCPFCNPSKDVEGIIVEDKKLYVVPSLGQITDGGYLLVIPKAHVSCLRALGGAAAAEFEQVIQIVRHWLIREYRVPVVGFEHGIVGQTVKHAHYHLVPSQKIAAWGSLSRRVRKDFPEASFELCPSLYHIAVRYAERQEPYLLWNSGFCYEVCWNPPAPPQYFRTVAAEILGRPERANWRTMDAELDRKLVQETTRRMRLYF